MQGDVLGAIWLMVNQNKIFKAVIGCGEVHSIKESVEFCFQSNSMNMFTKF